MPKTNVGNYLLTRLKLLGVDHVFGVCGDFVLGFCNQIIESGVEYVGTCNELNSAYAADGYARIKVPFPPHLHRSGRLLNERAGAGCAGEHLRRG